jgi:hypothetical protein
VARLLNYAARVLNYAARDAARSRMNVITMISFRMIVIAMISFPLSFRFS